MHIVSTNMTVADYCQGMERGEILVNREYQRSDKVWPAIARSYLIETIVLGYPVPKLSLYQVTDIKTKKTVKEIVDGQQRSNTVFDFYKNKLRLASSLETTEIAGRTLDEIDEDYQHRFLDASLSLDLLVSPTRPEVREAFRRINSYTIPLNAEEQRHAIFQGPFKWFIQRLARQFTSSFVQMGLFSEKQLIRMADTKLLAEVCHAFEHGITTTNKTALDRLYSTHDETFPKEPDWATRLTEALDQLREWPALHGGPLMKPYLAYSLILGLTHIRRPLGTLDSAFPLSRSQRFDEDTALKNLADLADALEDPDEAPHKFRSFIQACTSKTNVAKQRETRFQWICRAITSPTL